MTAQHPIDGQSRAQRVLSWLVDRPGRVVLGLVAITAVLVVAGISTAPDEDASFSPGGEIFDTGELVERMFRASTSELLFIVEDEGADALDLESLREWKRNSEELRASAELSPAFSTFFDDALGRTVVGFYTLADAVDDELVETDARHTLRVRVQGVGAEQNPCPCRGLSPYQRVRVTIHLPISRSRESARSAARRAASALARRSAAMRFDASTP